MKMTEHQKPESCASPQESKPVICVIVYTTTNGLYKGIAVVKGKDVLDAKRTFLANSQHNGAEKIRINKMYEVPQSYESMLLAEEYVKIM